MGGNTLEVPDIPHTSNMKNVDLVVQKMTHGREVKKMTPWKTLKP
jgi:hypothetical protein